MDSTHIWPTIVQITPSVDKRPSDADLLTIERIAAGDKRALEEIYSRFGKMLFRYILTLVVDRQLAEEVLQDTLVAVWKGAHRFKGRSSVRTWIFGIARRKVRDANRRRSLTTAGPGEAESLPASEPSPEEIVLLNDRRKQLAACLKRLAPPQREVLALVFFQGFSYKEAAEILGVPVGTVRSRLNRAKNTLQMFVQNSATEKKDE